MLLFGFGPSEEIIYLAAVALCFIVFFIVCVLLKRFRVLKLSYGKLTLIAPFVFLVGWMIFAMVHKFCTTPMDVTKDNLQGEYVIDNEMFKGQDADWQHEHYALKIDNEYLYLRIINNKKVIKEYKEAIHYEHVPGFSHMFFTFHGDYFSDRQLSPIGLNEIVLNKQKHHMLRLNPRLMANPFGFRVILCSTRYGNMFFKKGSWGWW